MIGIFVTMKKRSKYKFISKEKNTIFIKTKNATFCDNR